MTQRIACSQNDIMIVTCNIAAMDPAATPAAVNPTPAKTAGAAKTAATPVAIATTAFPDTSGSGFYSIHRNNNILVYCLLKVLKVPFFY